MNSITPTKARANFFELLKLVNETHSPIEIISGKNNNDAVIISKADWDSIQETLFLEQTGVMDIVRTRELDDSGFTDIDDIDWDNL